MIVGRQGALDDVMGDVCQGKLARGGISEQFVADQSMAPLSEDGSCYARTL